MKTLLNIMIVIVLFCFISTEASSYRILNIPVDSSLSGSCKNDTLSLNGNSTLNSLEEQYFNYVQQCIINNTMKNDTTFSCEDSTATDNYVKQCNSLNAKHCRAKLNFYFKPKNFTSTFYVCVATSCSKNKTDLSDLSNQFSNNYKRVYFYDGVANITCPGFPLWAIILIVIAIILIILIVIVIIVVLRRRSSTYQTL